MRLPPSEANKAGTVRTIGLAGQWDIAVHLRLPPSSSLENAVQTPVNLLDAMPSGLPYSAGLARQRPIRTMGATGRKLKPRRNQPFPVLP